jgi:hypothetical protein
MNEIDDKLVCPTATTEINYPRNSSLSSASTASKNNDMLSETLMTNSASTTNVSNMLSSSSASSPEPDLVASRACLFEAADELNKEILNFREILQLFNCAISQEQAWAVLYRCLIEFKQLLETHLELVKLNAEHIDINVLNFTKDGVILFRFKHASVAAAAVEKTSLLAENLEQERQLVEPKVLKSIAYLIFDALDYGNTYSNEPVLQTSLSHLLLMISGHYKEFSNAKAHSEDDEGYEQEEEDSICLDKAIEICVGNVAEADYHYRAVCRGLYVQAYELKVFLAKIEDSKVTLIIIIFYYL